ncbi:hypothetical protein HID58_012163 [Brassica napus]|uniref:Uncharacterized protein n=1 Tax=Brassica napus TaxID=3708 RepID=A0ABQ8E2Z1_BRANA|nr:hypothetical protein HID58_012163 [Brassica napus]
MALGALDLLLVADCARIWVRSEIRDPPEASTCRDRPRLCSAVSPQSIYSCAQKAASMVFLSEGLSPLPRSHRLQKGHLLQGVLCSFRASCPIPKLPVDCCFRCSKQVYILVNFCVSLGLICWRPPPAELRGVSQALPSMPARSHFDEQEALWFFGVFLNFLQPLKPDWLKSISWFH